jgi:PAS domain S-box-containing protein
MATARRVIRVLCVDDEPDLADTAAAFLERDGDRLSVRTVESAQEALAVLDGDPIDCIVSDYDIPGTNGIELLERVRTTHADLPFILYTGKGSEAVASDAISAGVTDYLQKGVGTSQYTLLANRIRNAVDNYRAQAKLAEREKRLNLFFEQSPLGVVEWDEQFDFVRMNEAAQEILGYTHEDLVGGSWEQIVPESARDAVDDVVSGLLEDDGGYYSVNGNVRKNGDRIVCEWHNRVVTDEDGAVVAVFSQFQDITERNERERRLEEVTSQYRTLVENFPDGGAFLFDEECRYVRAGGEGLETIGLSESDLVGATPHDVFADDIADETVEHYRETLAGHTTTYEREYDGNRYQVLTVPVRSDGDVAYGIAVSRDVTERTERRRQLERQNERLERFTSVVSHDIRNPLNVVDGRLELAQQECDSPHLDDAVSALDRSFALIDDVLTLAREGRVVSEPEPVDLASVCREHWRTIETAEATLTTDVDRRIRADPARLGQLFENLVGNAIEHAGADVRVRVGELDDGFYVADDGTGIPPGDREAVFDAGYSTADRGTGFGLRIVEEIADAHGWAVGVTDSNEGGARFEITGVEHPGG